MQDRAVQIQAAIRGRQARRGRKEAQSATRIQAVYRGMAIRRSKSTAEAHGSASEPKHGLRKIMGTNDATKAPPPPMRAPNTPSRPKSARRENKSMITARAHGGTPSAKRSAAEERRRKAAEASARARGLLTPEPAVRECPRPSPPTGKPLARSSPRNLIQTTNNRNGPTFGAADPLDRVAPKPVSGGAFHGAVDFSATMVKGRSSVASSPSKPRSQFASPFAASLVPVAANNRNVKRSRILRNKPATTATINSGDQLRSAVAVES
eukprot:SAG31_NODE_9611_length_1251_cov_1.218750_1_plen_266_part_00